MARNNTEFWNFIFKIFNKFSNAKSTYNDIKNNPEARPVSTIFAKKSILYSIWGTILFALSFGAIFWGISLLSSTAFIFGIILIVIGISIIFYPFAYIFLSLNLLIKQLKLNKKAYGWIALVVFVLLIALIVAGVILAFNFLI